MKKKRRKMGFFNKKSTSKYGKTKKMERDDLNFA